jgi:hypothetical protein
MSHGRLSFAIVRGEIVCVEKERDPTARLIADMDLLVAACRLCE